MSEVAPNIAGFARRLPKAAANDMVNEVFRRALSRARDEARLKPHATRDEYAGAVIESFYVQLGAGAIESVIERITKNFPDRYLGVIPRDETALRFLDRVDYRSYSHPAVISPLVGINVRDSSEVSYMGTDKFAHFIQQGYDYLVIYSAIEAVRPGLGTLFAQAWGAWSEGEEVSEAAIEKYLKERRLPSDAEDVKYLKRKIDEFLTESEMIEFMSPTPEFAKPITPLRKLAHFIGTHQFGILGLSSNGIISYADLDANDAGLKFFLDLKNDPDSVVQNFDIKNYASANWDEDVRKSRFVPPATERLAEAGRGERESFFVKGLGFDLEAPRNIFSLSFPFIYYPTPGGDIELRVRAGISTAISGTEGEHRGKDRVYSESDACARISGLSFACVSAAAGLTSKIASDRPSDGVIPSFGVNYEVMLLGWTSFRLGWKFEPRDRSSSAGIGALMMWR